MMRFEGGLSSELASECGDNTLQQRWIPFSGYQCASIEALTVSHLLPQFVNTMSFVCRMQFHSTVMWFTTTFSAASTTLFSYLTFCSISSLLITLFVSQISFVSNIYIVCAFKRVQFSQLRLVSPSGTQFSFVHVQLQCWKKRKYHPVWLQEMRNS